MTESINTMTSGATLGQIISVDQQLEDLLKSIGLNPAGQENKTLQSICRQHKWSEVEILNWLKDNARHGGVQGDDTSAKANTGEGKTVQIEDLLLKIEEAFLRVHKIHGNQYPWLKNMQWPLEQFAELLKNYTEFEKEKLYPFIAKLGDGKKRMDNQPAKVYDDILGTLQANQKRLKELMREIREKGFNFKNPPVTCSTMRILNQNFKILFQNLELQLRNDKHLISFVVNQETS